MKHGSLRSIVPQWLADALIQMVVRYGKEAHHKVFEPGVFGGLRGMSYFEALTRTFGIDKPADYMRLLESRCERALSNRHNSIDDIREILFS